MPGKVRPLNLEEPDDSDRPKEIHITEADGGWIGRKIGGGRDFDDPQIVSEDLDDLMEKCKKFLKGK